MKKTIAILAVATAAVLALKADAVPACFPTNERLGMVLSTASYNGAAGQPVMPGSGQYATDAGTTFYVGSIGELNVVPVVDSKECPAPAQQVTVTVTDPWTGEQRTLSVSGP